MAKSYFYTKSAIDTQLAQKQDTLTIDTALSNVEVIINGQDIIFRNTSDWSKKKLIFNEDHSVTWETIQ